MSQYINRCEFNSHVCCKLQLQIDPSSNSHWINIAFLNRTQCTNGFDTRKFQICTPFDALKSDIICCYIEFFHIKIHIFPIKFCGMLMHVIALFKDLSTFGLHEVIFNAYLGKILQLFHKRHDFALESYLMISTNIL